MVIESWMILMLEDEKSYVMNKNTKFIFIIHLIFVFSIRRAPLIFYMIPTGQYLRTDKMQRQAITCSL